MRKNGQKQAILAFNRSKQMPLELASNPEAMRPALSRRFSVAPMMDGTDKAVTMGL
jgi:hypothetical protein